MEKCGIREVENPMDRGLDALDAIFIFERLDDIGHQAFVGPRSFSDLTKLGRYLYFRDGHFRLSEIAGLGQIGSSNPVPVLEGPNG